MKVIVDKQKRVLYFYLFQFFSSFLFYFFSVKDPFLEFICLCCSTNRVTKEIKGMNGALKPENEKTTKKTGPTTDIDSQAPSRRLLLRTTYCRGGTGQTALKRDLSQRETDQTK